MDSEFLVVIATEISHHPLGYSEHVRTKRFRALFGISPEVCYDVWNLLPGKSIVNACLNICFGHVYF